MTVQARCVEINDETVERLTAKLCDITIAVIRTLRAEDQQKYIDRLHARTRAALEDVAA